ncbi:MAG: GAF domain-containing SpoIIE family protein phosphatase [Planctomycetota bacterium]
MSYEDPPDPDAPSVQAARFPGDSTSLSYITEMMRELSMARDPQEMVRLYGQRVRSIMRNDGFVSLSRRDLEAPWYRVTRSSVWDSELNPWTQAEELPLHDRGLLGDLLYGDEPVVMNDVHIDPDDPSHAYLEGARSLMAIPLFDDGVALNMVVQWNVKPNGFDEEQLPGTVWMSNLFGRATRALVLTQELREANKQVEAAKAAIDREVSAIAAMQQSLLPAKLPTEHGLSLAVDYRPSQIAGGDFYDFMPLEDGRIGILIADVSGHGVAAAVMTAITHAIGTTSVGEPTPPSKVLKYLNRHLCKRYTRATAQFITGFYGIYDPKEQTLQYSSAGHPPPCVVNGCGGLNYCLAEGRGLPLGIREDEDYQDAIVGLGEADVLVLYTDGITEARSEQGDYFGVDRLERVLQECGPDAKQVVAKINQAVHDFTDGAPAGDDQTLLVAKVVGGANGSAG